jgi:hypothetical protein
MSDEATIEIEQTLSSQFKSLDKASKRLAAVLCERDDVSEIVQLALEGHETDLFGREHSQITAIIRNAVRPGFTVRQPLVQVIVDTIRKCVAESTQNSTASDSDLKLKGTHTMHSRERPDVAALLDLPSFRDAVQAVEEHQKIYSDQAKRLPEKKILDERGAFSLEIPRHKL